MFWDYLWFFLETGFVAGFYLLAVAILILAVSGLLYCAYLPFRPSIERYGRRRRRRQQERFHESQRAVLLRYFPNRS